MSRIFITGSADGLGQMAADLLIKAGNQVVLHARNNERAEHALKAIPEAESVLTGDLSSIAETIKLAEEVNKFGFFDAVIHNAGVGYKEATRINTIDNLSHIFAVNSLAPYLLTCLINKPKRLVYLSSALHRDGDISLKDLNWKSRPWNGLKAYSDSKLHDLILAFAVARLWPDVYSNAVEPGWVSTRMGGLGATDNLQEGPVTQAWLAGGADVAADVSGKYLYHQEIGKFSEAANDIELQEKFLAECEKISGIKLAVSFPADSFFRS